MNFKKLPLLFLAAILLPASIQGQNTVGIQNLPVYPSQSKVLFDTKGKEIIAAHDDSLIIINSLPNRKDIWVYRPSTDSTTIRKAEIHYNPHAFAFTNGRIAFYDVIMNRFIFSKEENGSYVDYLGDKLKGVGEVSIGISLPRLYPFKNGWYAFSLAGLAYMDNKLLYGVLDNEGKWLLPPTSLFTYPDGLMQNFGLVKAYTSTTFKNKQLVFAEIAANHTYAKEYQQPKGMFMLIEIGEAFVKTKEVPIFENENSPLLGSDVPCMLELITMRNRFAVTIKAESTLCAKLFNPTYEQVKTVAIADGVSVLKTVSTPLLNGFITLYSTDQHLAMAYISEDGSRINRWRVYDAEMKNIAFYAMNDGSNFYILINDGQKNEIALKTIPLADLQKKLGI